MTDERAQPMSCEEVVRLVWAYLDDEIDDERRRRVREHLALCGPCRDHFTFDGAFLRSVARLIDVPDDAAPLRARVLEALRAEGYDERP